MMILSLAGPPLKGLNLIGIFRRLCRGYQGRLRRFLYLMWSPSFQAGLGYQPLKPRSQTQFHSILLIDNITSKTRMTNSLSVAKLCLLYSVWPFIQVEGYRFRVYRFIFDLQTTSFPKNSWIYPIPLDGVTLYEFVSLLDFLLDG